jgi:hypothetical protein
MPEHGRASINSKPLNSSNSNISIGIILFERSSGCIQLHKQVRHKHLQLGVVAHLTVSSPQTVAVSIFAGPHFAFNVKRLEFADHVFPLAKSVLRTHG